MAYIYPTCYQRNGDPASLCFHFFINNYPERPLPYDSDTLLKEARDASNLSSMISHLTSKDKTDYKDRIIINNFNQVAHPPTKEYPVNGRRPVTITNIYNTERCEKEINDIIEADCWSVFARKHKGLEPTTTFYFDSRTKGTEEGKRFREKGELLGYLDQHPDEELCIALGDVDCSTDYYIFKLEQNKYLCTSVSVEFYDD